MVTLVYNNPPPQCFLYPPSRDPYKSHKVSLARLGFPEIVAYYPFPLLTRRPSILPTAPPPPPARPISASTTFTSPVSSENIAQGLRWQSPLYSVFVKYLYTYITATIITRLGIKKNLDCLASSQEASISTRRKIHIAPSKASTGVAVNSRHRRTYTRHETRWKRFYVLFFKAPLSVAKQR